MAGSHQENRWYMDVHPPQNGGIGTQGHLLRRFLVNIKTGLARFQIPREK